MMGPGPTAPTYRERNKHTVNPELNELIELNQSIEDQQNYYNQQFINPNTGEQAGDIARALYELSQE